MDGLPDEGFLDPRLIRSSQDSILPTFRTGETVLDLAAGLRSGRIGPADVPPIRIFERGGKHFTLDLRRLGAFRLAGMPVPYRVATEREVRRESWNLTTKNDGRSVRVTGVG